MTWTRLGDDFYDDDRIDGLSHEAFRLYVYALVWANKQLTDGLVPLRRLQRLLPDIDTGAAITELIASGVASDAGTSLQLDWAGQEPSEDVHARKEANAQRNRNLRERKRLHVQGDHSKCDPRHCPSLMSDTARDASRDASRATPRPVPSRPVGTGTGTTHLKAASNAAAFRCEGGGHKLVADGSCALCEFRPDIREDAKA